MNTTTTTKAASIAAKFSVGTATAPRTSPAQLADMCREAGATWRYATRTGEWRQGCAIDWVFADDSRIRFQDRGWTVR